MTGAVSLKVSGPRSMPDPRVRAVALTLTAASLLPASPGKVTSATKEPSGFTVATAASDPTAAFTSSRR